MSGRMHPRGRYPKGATTAYQNQPLSKQHQSQPSTQLPASDYHSTAGVQFYNVHSGQQIQENYANDYTWQPQLNTNAVSIPNQSQPVPTQSNILTTYSQQRGNDTWNWTPENGMNAHQPQIHQQPIYQNSEMQQQHSTFQHTEMQQQHPAFQHTEMLQQPLLHHSEIQKHSSFQNIEMPQQMLSQHTSEVQQQQPAAQYEQQQQQHTLSNSQGPVLEQAPLIQSSCTTNVDYALQNYTISAVPQTNERNDENHLNYLSYSTVSDSILQPKQSSWTYNNRSQNVDVYSSSQFHPQQWATGDLSNGSSINDVKNWPKIENNWNQVENSFLPNQQTAVLESDYSVSQNFASEIPNQTHNNIVSNAQNVQQFVDTSKVETTECSAEILEVREHDNGSLINFFNESVQEEVKLSSYIDSVGSSNSNILLTNEPDNKLCFDDDVKNALLPTFASECINQVAVDQNSFVEQSEKSQVSLSPALSTEEPLNQEVPDTNDPLAMSQENPQRISGDESSDEPLNQQIPVESDDLSITLPTAESIASPTKGQGSPSRELGKPTYIADLSVLKLVSEQSVCSLASSSEGNRTSIHDVNLETTPENLEMPPDHDEEKKLSLLHNPLLRMHHPLKNETENIKRLPSTTLFENPDLSCVTFVPAAPLPVPVFAAQSPVLQMSNEVQAKEDLSVSDMNHHENRMPPSAKTLPLSSLGASESLEKATVCKELFQHTEPNENIKHRVSEYKVEPLLSNSNDFKTSSPKRNDPNTSASAKVNHSYGGSPLLSDLEIENVSHHDVAENENRDNHRIMRDQQNSDYPSEYDKQGYNRWNNGRRSQERHPDDYHQKPLKYPSYDDRPYAGNSRPSSRMSLNESSEALSYRVNKYKSYMSDRERSPSRMSDPDAIRSRRDTAYQYDSNPYRTYHHDDRYYPNPDSNYYRGYDYDSYQRQQYYAYYDPYWSNYRPNSYNYGFHDELYRNDPSYRQQLEQYKEYCQRYNYENEYERLSTHSGRSSANEFAKDMQSRFTESDRNSTTHYSPDDYAEEQSSQISLDNSNRETSTPVTRLTPVKFASMHPFAYVETGQLITVIPKQGGSGHPTLVEIHDIQVLVQGLNSYEELKTYQGPLVRGRTHKNDVIDFCMSKIQFFKNKEDIPDRESYILLWELLVLLLRQNGSVVGSDIAELLLKSHEVLRLSTFRTDTPVAELSLADPGNVPIHNHSVDTTSPDEGIVVSLDKTILNASQSADVDNLTRKFREFLLFGHKKDALEWAMKHGLWGHALFLASKMDLRTHANVMTRFANSLVLNDPLQTLYQLMSGRQPAAVTSIADKRWGDWRPHLAMILSNPSSHTEVDLKSITSLGDTLVAQGCLPAAHFCYLMAQIEFGSYLQKSSKLVLLTADHHLSFNEFSTNEAIQCTEIYEYAQSLANPGFMLSHLQAYKFLYATRLLDHGFLQEALHYCEVLASTFLSNSSFPLNLIQQVYEIASRLKYHDPHFLQGQGEVEDQDDPEWLKKLFALSNNELHQSMSTNYEECNSSVSYAESYNQEASEEVSQEHANDIQNCNYYQPQTDQTYYRNTSMGIPDNTESMTQVEAAAYEDGQVPMTMVSPMYYPDVPVNQWSGSRQSLSQETYSHRNSIEQQSGPNSSIPSANVSPTAQTYAKKFDFYGNDSKQVHGIPALNRNRTSSTSSTSFQRNRHDSTVSTGSDYGVNNTTVSKTSSDTHKVENKENIARQQIGRSWLGGIFSKFLPRAPNQMILPDDKNPTIVWDSSRSCWTNTDANEEDTCSQPVAPPTDVQLSNKENSNGNFHPMSLPTNALILPTANKFKMAKVKGMRQNYVDIMNSATQKASLPSPELFPTMPVQLNKANYFVPPPAAAAAEDLPTDFLIAPPVSYSGSHTHTTSEETQDMPRAPPMFDPSEFETRKSSISSVRQSVGPARRAYLT